MNMIHSKAFAKITTSILYDCHIYVPEVRIRPEEVILYEPEEEVIY